MRYARRARCLADRLPKFGLEAGGEASKRLAAVFDLAVSGDLLIRLVRTNREGDCPPVKVLGIGE